MPSIPALQLVVFTRFFVFGSLDQMNARGARTGMVHTEGALEWSPPAGSENSYHSHARRQ
jgi:hypothetical protein